MTFFFTMVFMLWVFWRPQEWLFPWLWGWNLLDGIVAISLLSLLLEIDAGRIRFPRLWFVWMLVGFFIATIMSHIANTYFAGLITTLPITFKLVFYPILLYCVLDRPSRVRAVVLIFVGMGCIMVYHAWLQQTRGYGFAGQPPLRIYDGRRGGYIFRSLFFGIFGDPNDLSQFLAVCLPLCFAIPKRMNFLKFCLCCIPAWYMYKAIGWTGSRGGLVGLAAVMGASFLMFVPNRFGPTFVILGVVAGLLLTPFAGSVLDASARDRVVFWGLANWQFKNNLIFGIGYNMFWTVARGMTAHNCFVYCYTEIGLFGYWFWFGMLLLGLIGCWRTRMILKDVLAEDPHNVDLRYIYRVAGLCVVSVIGYAGAGYFLSRAFIYPYFFMVALLNAFPTAVERYLPEGHPAIIRPKFDIGFLVTVGTLGSVLYIYLSIILLNKAFGY